MLTDIERLQKQSRIFELQSKILELQKDLAIDDIDRLPNRDRKAEKRVVFDTEIANIAAQKAAIDAQLTGV